MGIQGLGWFRARLRQDADGDVADQFLSERTFQPTADGKPADKGRCTVEVGCDQSRLHTVEKAHLLRFSFCDTDQRDISRSSHCLQVLRKRLRQPHVDRITVKGGDVSLELPEASSR